MTIDEIIETLNKFEPFPADDAVHDNESFLSDLMDAWEKTGDNQKAIPAIFRLMEKYPHADFGSPGPLVHALEAKAENQYEWELHKSLMRKPTPLTAWMYNRIINTVTDAQILRGHIQRLKLFYNHPLADTKTKEEIAGFVKFQESRFQ